MKLDPQELERIREFVTIYKTLPPAQKDMARGKASALSTWRGTDPHTRAVNAYLHREMCIADQVERAGSVTSNKDVPAPTTAEVMRALRPVAMFAGGLVAIGGAGYWIIVGIAAVGRAVEAFFLANGGWIVGGCLGVVAFVFLLSGLRGETTPTEMVETREEKRAVNINIVVDGEQKNVKVG